MGTERRCNRYDIHGVKSDIIEPPHPLESAYHTLKVRQEEIKPKILINTCGASFPMKMGSIVRFSPNLKGLVCGVRGHAWDFERFGFQDYLNGCLASVFSISSLAPKYNLGDPNLLLDASRPI